MFKILADASLPALESYFDHPFALRLYSNERELLTNIHDADVLLCRSTLKVDARILANCKLQVVATASSGTDHIDERFLKQNNITLLDAKGCNAQAVSDYVLSTIAYLQKFKNFTGTKIGVVGYGAVGSFLVKRLQDLQFKVKVYDPFKTCVLAPQISSLNDFADCDLISVHANLHTDAPYSTYRLLNARTLTAFKKNCVIINAARGEIVDEASIVQFPLTYCCDVFSTEPEVGSKILRYSALATPHIAGHSIEAKKDAVRIISAKIHNLFNYPQQPIEATDTPIEVVIDDTADWQTAVLSYYNPIGETELLKAASNIGAQFIHLRKKHKFRHNYSVIPQLTCFLNNTSRYS